MRVTALRYITWAGKTYLPGEEFEVTEHEASELIADGKAEPAEEEDETA
jgi:hypothetical protein